MHALHSFSAFYFRFMHRPYRLCSGDLAMPMAFFKKFI
jgi:hypothetical protein